VKCFLDPSNSCIGKLWRALLYDQKRTRKLPSGPCAILGWFGMNTCAVYGPCSVRSGSCHVSVFQPVGLKT
jgi:hypothetical protein